MQVFGKEIATILRGGECIELIGDVGAGKTTLVKGIAHGLESEDDVQSPSFTINRVYRAKNNLEIYHYDFYRLRDAGIMHHEIEESLNDPHKITIIEWAESIHSVLPENRLKLEIIATDENVRTIKIEGAQI